MIYFFKIMKKLLNNTLLGLQILILCSFLLSCGKSSETGKEVDLKYLTADFNSYLGEVITVEGKIDGVIYNNKRSRAEFTFSDTYNIDVLVEKETPLYKKLIDMELDFSDSVKVTGKVSMYANTSDKIFILAHKIEDTTPFLSWSTWLAIIIFVIIVFLSFLPSSEDDT